MQLLGLYAKTHKIKKCDEISLTNLEYPTEILVVIQYTVCYVKQLFFFLKAPPNYI